MGDITFAKVGGPPADWMGVRVFNVETGVEMKNIVEVDTVEGYVLRHRVDAQGLLIIEAGSARVSVERVNGAFRIERAA